MTGIPQGAFTVLFIYGSIKELVLAAQDLVLNKSDALLTLTELSSLADGAVLVFAGSVL